MVDPLRAPGRKQGFVCHRGPGGAQLPDFSGSGRCRIQNARFDTEPSICLNHARRSKNMSVVIALIALGVRRMDRDIGGDFVTRNQMERETGRELPSGVGTQLGRERHLVLSRNRRIGSPLRILRCIPESGTVACPPGCFRDDEKRAHDPGLSSVIVDHSIAAIRDHDTRAIGRSRGCGATGRT